MMCWKGGGGGEVQVLRRAGAGTDRVQESVRKAVERGLLSGKLRGGGAGQLKVPAREGLLPLKHQVATTHLAFLGTILHGPSPSLVPVLPPISFRTRGLSVPQPTAVPNPVPTFPPCPLSFYLPPVPNLPALVPATCPLSPHDPPLSPPATSPSFPCCSHLQNEFDELCRQIQQQHAEDLERVRKHNQEIWPQVQVARLAQAELGRVQVRGGRMRTWRRSAA